MTSRIPYYRHDLGQKEIDLLTCVLQGEILTTGEYTAQFEHRFATYLGRKHALGVSSCTGALHLSLLALGIGPGDEVITTPMTFIASSTSILEAGATPIFVDVEADTGNMDMSRVESAITPRTRALLPVHLYGLMCDMRALRDIADRRGLKIVEDCAHCIEGVREGVRPGEMGDTACFSFYATKNLACGEGGAVVTDNDDLHRRLRSLSIHGMTKTAFDRSREGYTHWDMIELGWKYNMSNIEAALLIPQFERIDYKLVQREQIAQYYNQRLAGLSDVIPPRSLHGAVHARHVYPVRVPSEMRDRVVASLKVDGVGCVVNYRAIHLLTFFRERYGYKRGDFPNAERIGDETISLPFYPGMPLEHVDSVAEALQRALSRNSVPDA